MYLNTTVKIPKIKGKIITKKKGTSNLHSVSVRQGIPSGKTIRRSAKDYRWKDVFF